MERRGDRPPFFSVCVPQYNRTSFLIEACRSLASQVPRDFELCISDDRSTDGREAELLTFLQESGMAFVWERQPANGRYDANLRAAIGLARGRWCFLLGNDDALTGPSELTRVERALTAWPGARVAICNYEDYETGELYARVGEGPLGAGPDAAADLFRHFSFVSGVVIERAVAQSHATAEWDGSEMYQMYLACRAIASGAQCIGIADAVVRKDIRIPGESVDSYAAAPRLDPCPIIERKLNLVWIPSLVMAAIAPFTTPPARARLQRRVLKQLLGFTYPFWLFEYRRIQSWRYALGIALGTRPRNLIGDLSIGPIDRLRAQALYLASTVAGLLLPLAWLSRARARLYRIAKRGPSLP